MRIGDFVLFVGVLAVPSGAVAQTSFTPLPPVPAMEPL